MLTGPWWCRQNISLQLFVSLTIGPLTGSQFIQWCKYVEYNKYGIKINIKKQQLQTFLNYLVKVKKYKANNLLKK